MFSAQKERVAEQRAGAHGTGGRSSPNEQPADPRVLPIAGLVAVDDLTLGGDVFSDFIKVRVLCRDREGVGANFVSIVALNILHGLRRHQRDAHEQYQQLHFFVTRPVIFD